jgi:N-methylhydantoinase A/oxoprolinase/acetone carboxylase beta subunit
MALTSARLGIGLDTGGTFTDIVLYDLLANRVLRKAKKPTTHGAYAICVGEAFRALALTAEESGALRRVVLSTTLATNAVAEDKVHPAGLVLEPADIRVEPGFHSYLALLKSEMSFDCFELTAVSPAEVLEKVAPWAAKVESFAVSAYASTRDPRHEQEIAQVLTREFGKPVVLGSQLTHRLNFLERARAAVLNAGLLPVILAWLSAVEGLLRSRGIACPLYLVKGDGSLMTAREAREMPVHTLHSGPAASLQGGSRLSGRAEALIIDVGGTTTDLGRVREGMGLLREGGVRINGRAIAVDGLDLATFGLGGDSRLRRAGDSGLRFAHQRVLPFCRIGELDPRFDPSRLEQELSESWHFGDLDLLELLALDPHQSGSDPGGSPLQSEIVAELRGGPRRERALSARRNGAEFQIAVAELLRRRILLRIGFTPTDLFCAEGRVPRFSHGHAEAMLKLCARMLDLPAAELREKLWGAVQRQITGILTGFFAGLDPAVPAEADLAERLTAQALAAAASGQAALRWEPGTALVLVGAAAPLFFLRAPDWLRPALVVPEHADVANAVGAVASRFVLRDTVTIEPLRNGGVELFDHRGKRAFASLAEAQTEARRLLQARLNERAEALRLEDTEFRLTEEVLEDYADFSRRTRRELVLSRLEAVLTGMPEG